MAGEMNDIENKGFYKLTWMQRIAYGLAGAALYNVYNTFTYFYTMNEGSYINAIFIIINIIVFFWEFLVAYIIDKRTTRWGKYRSYLLTCGIPITLITILCISLSNIVNSFIILAIIFYIAFKFLYPFVNLSFDALNASLTRDTHEVTVLIITASVLSIIGSIIFDIQSTNLLFSTLFYNLPSIVILCFIPMLRKLIGKKKIFHVFGIISILGYAMLYFSSRMSYEKNILGTVGKITVSTCISVIMGYMWVLIPEIISFSEYNINRRNAGIIYALVSLFSTIGNAIGGFLMTIILTFTGYQAKGYGLVTNDVGDDAGDNIADNVVDDVADNVVDDVVDGGSSYGFNSFNLGMTITLLISIILLIFCFAKMKERVVTTKEEAKNVKISDIWNEVFRNKPLRFFAYLLFIVYTITNLYSNSNFYLVLMSNQTEMAKEGIRWTNSVIPAILVLLMMVIVNFYSLTDEKVDEINEEIELRHHQKSVEEY